MLGLVIEDCADNGRVGNWAVSKIPPVAEMSAWGALQLERDGEVTCQVSTAIKKGSRTQQPWQVMYNRGMVIYMTQVQMPHNLHLLVDYACH
jgi:hypothetical protein